VNLYPDDKNKTEISTGQGLWQFTVMPFGLCNVPAMFERLMKTVLSGVTYESCPVYLDDVVVIGRTFQEQLLNLQKVFKRFRKVRLKLNPEKCQPSQKEVSYLGHIVSPDPKKLRAVRH
jgi:hypothetical protein